MSFKPIRPPPNPPVIEAPKPIPTPPPPTPPTVPSQSDLRSSSPKVRISPSKNSVTNPPKPNLPPSPSTSAIQLDLPIQGIDTFVNKVIMFNRGQMSKELFMESLQGMFPMLKTLPEVNVEIKLNFFSNEARQLLNQGLQPQPSHPPIQSIFSSQPEVLPPTENCSDFVDEFEQKAKKIRRFWMASKDSYPYAFKKSFFFVTKRRNQRFGLEVVNLDQTLSSLKLGAEWKKSPRR